MSDYLELLKRDPMVWGLFVVYLVGTSWLAWQGHKKTDDIESFAVGDGNMNPLIVGVTLAASMASTATFVINPGFVYVHGLSAFGHLGIAVGLGIALGLLVMSTGFRRVGEKGGAITLPQWVGTRYGSKAMAVFFAAVNLLSLSFVVLIVAGLSIVMQNTLGLSNVESLLLIIGFVFSYIFIGGTYAHAYTNTFQGVLMVFISLIIIGSGFELLGDGVGPFLDKIATKNANLVTWVNPESSLFSTFFTVYLSGFVIGFALVCQPHILTKALYVKTDKAVRQYIGVALVITVVFFGLLMVGLYAHAADLDPSLFVDPNTGKFRQDMVMTMYIQETFSPAMRSVIIVSLMAAGMSTLDGILVALSSIAANDLFLNLTENTLLKGKPRVEKLKLAHKASQGILIAMGVGAFVISLNPPELLGIFGQVGVYGIIAASTAPILFGITTPWLGKGPAFAASIIGLAVHFALYAWGAWAASNGVDLSAAAASSAWGVVFDSQAPLLGLRNPGVTATYGIIASLLVAGPAAALTRGSAGAANDDEAAPAAAA